MSTVSTIGFTQTSAENFFTRLQKANVRKIIDVRLNNTSQLSGFAKATDLPYFLITIAEISYHHMPLLAPTGDILKKYKTEKGSWGEYEPKFLDLIQKRQIETRLTPEYLDGACLLCSEAKPHHCHRRLVVEYLQRQWGANSLTVRHL